MFLKEYELLGNLFGSKKNKHMRCIMTDLRKCNKRKKEKEKEHKSNEKHFEMNFEVV